MSVPPKETDNQPDQSIEKLQKEKMSLEKKNKKLETALIKISKQKEKLEESIKSNTNPVDVTHLIMQNNYLVSVIHTHFRLFSQKLNLLISKQFSQFSSQLSSLSSRISYLQKRMKYRPSQLPSNHYSLLQNSNQTLNRIRKELFRGFRSLRISPPENLSSI